MACDEITKALAWAKQSAANQVFPVTAYFTKHTGFADEPTAQPFPNRDYCWYAVGPVSYVVPPTPARLKGDLTLYVNKTDGTMSPAAGYTVGVEIFDDGTISY